MKNQKQIEKEIFNIQKVNFFTKGQYKYLAHTLANTIQDDENLKIICDGKRNNKLKKIICTNKRIIIVNDNNVIQEREDIYLKSIESISQQTKGLWCDLTIVMAGKEFILNNVSDSIKLINIINEQK